MSDLRIRSETAAWAEPWLPPPVDAAPSPAMTDLALAPLRDRLAAELTALFGLPASVQPGPAPPDNAPRVGHELAALLATLRLGGDPARPVQTVTGFTLARHARRIAEVVDAVSRSHWPATQPPTSHWMEIGFSLEGVRIAGLVELRAPPPAPSDARPRMAPGQRVAMLDVPLRARVELAGDVVPLGQLLPLVPGRVVPITAASDMPLLLGDHCIGRVSLTPLPDGRQQASITRLSIIPHGDRA